MQECECGSMRSYEKFSCVLAEMVFCMVPRICLRVHFQMGCIVLLEVLPEAAVLFEFS